MGTPTGHFKLVCTQCHYAYGGVTICSREDLTDIFHEDGWMLNDDWSESICYECAGKQVGEAVVNEK